MSRETPDHHDVEMLLRVYELRREAVMRQSRDALRSQFWPRSYDDVAAVLRADHPLNAAYRQVSTYWEMVYGMVRHGIVHAEYFLESNGEGLFLFAKVAPHLDRLRKEYSPMVFRNAEWVATQCEPGRRLYEVIQARVRRMMEAR